MPQLAAFVILADLGSYGLHTWGTKIPLSVMVSKHEQEALGRSCPMSKSAFLIIVSKTSKCTVDIDIRDSLHIIEYV